MTHLLRRVAIIGLLAVASRASATPLQQHLSRSSSSITFGVDSQADALRMNGSIRDFSGSILIDPRRITDARIKFSTTLSSATLPPEQVMQAIFLQSILARVERSRTHFESTRIEHINGARYLVHGTYSWGKTNRSLAVPIELINATDTRTEIRIAAREPFKATKTPPEFAHLAQSAKGSTGWATARLVFLASKVAS